MSNINEFHKETEVNELNEQKKWLFRENVRLQMEKQELQELQSALQEEKRKITVEKEALKRRVAQADKRMQQDEYMIGQKQKILENGFRQLDSDKRNFELKQAQLEKMQQPRNVHEFEVTPNMFFYGVNNSLALRKRYKDLLKIYHPDNTCGNEEVLIAITKEYEMLKQKYYDI